MIYVIYLFLVLTEKLAFFNSCNDLVSNAENKNKSKQSHFNE